LPALILLDNVYGAWEQRWDLGTPASVVWASGYDHVSDRLNHQLFLARKFTQTMDHACSKTLKLKFSALELNSAP